VLEHAQPIPLIPVLDDPALAQAKDDEAGDRARLARGRQAQLRNWAKGMDTRAKTDGQDTQLLARDGAACQPVAQPRSAVEVSELDSLLKRRQNPKQMLQQENNRLRELAGRSTVTTHLARVIEALNDALCDVETATEAHLSQHSHLPREVNRWLALPGIGPEIVWPLLVLLLSVRPDLRRSPVLTSGSSILCFWLRRSGECSG
jgi:hypothetical protein